MSITLADLSVTAARATPTCLGCDSVIFFTVPPEDEAPLVKSGRFAPLDDGEIKDGGEDASIRLRSLRLLAPAPPGLVGTLNA